MFCRNCGNKLGDSDKFCAQCGNPVNPPEKPPSISDKDISIEKNDEEILRPNEPGTKNASDAEDIKTPFFNFKWNVNDFPNEVAGKSEDIDFKWATTEESPIVKKMKEAADPGEIANSRTFSENEQEKEAITDEWYEPFSMKKNPDEETLYKFKKRNEEFQELLDKEFEKYNATKRTTLPNDATRKYHIDDFKEEMERFKEEDRKELKLPEKEQTTGITDSSVQPDTPTESTKTPVMTQKTEAEKPTTGDSYISGFINTSFTSPFQSSVTPDSVSRANDPVNKSLSIDEDEFLKGLPAGDGNNLNQPGTPTSPVQTDVVQSSNKATDGSNTEDTSSQKIIGPEIVNKPVVFPFDLDDHDESNIDPVKNNTVESNALPKKEQGDTEEQKKEVKTLPVGEHTAQTPVQQVQAPISTPKPVFADKKIEKKEHSHSNTLIKILIVMIIIILILLTGLLIIKMAPESSIGIMLNNLMESLLTKVGAQEPDITQ